MSEQQELIPRKTLFGNPERTGVQLSHDGEHISFLAPVEGVMNVWVAPADSLEEAHPVTQDTDRGIHIYFWTYNPAHLLYVQDQGGDEDWHVYSVNIESGDTRDLTPYEGVSAFPFGTSRRFPDEALVGVNLRDPQHHDLFRINVLSGDSRLVAENDIGAAHILVDHDLEPRLARISTPVGGSDWLALSESGEWESTMIIGPEDDMTTSALYFDPGGRTLYMFDSRGRDTSALMAVDTETGETTELGSDPRADVSGIIAHPVTSRPQAVSFEYDRLAWRVLDDSIAGDLERIAAPGNGDFDVASRSLDDRKWIVQYEKDDGPEAYYLYYRDSGNMDYLFSNRPSLETAPLTPMHTAVIKARDGLDLIVYYTLPVDSGEETSDRPAEPLPTVLLVHGGPWGRDSWGYSSIHQLLANRGYAVVSVNFRGSTGLGKRFVNAGDREWAGAMHDDLIDVVEWVVHKGIADRDRVAIMGGSYGGYATLVGLTFTPEVFACGVDIVGPSNLNTLLETVPPYWTPMLNMFRTRVGDDSTEEGKRFLWERSPLSRVGDIVRPLLIAQGANDPRVKQSESDQIVDAMRERGIPVTYLLYPDEGHGFARPENNLSFVAVAEAFLARCLGGRYEPIGGDFVGSSVQVIVGEDEVPGLAGRPS